MEDIWKGVMTYIFYEIPTLYFKFFTVLFVVLTQSSSRAVNMRSIGMN